MDAPEKISTPDYSKLEELVDSYVEFIQSDDFHEDNDFAHYIFEEAITAIYGKGFWDWYNDRIK